GNFATFKILPAADGTYIVTFAGAIALDDKVISINPIDADRGDYALATPNAVGGLRSGVKVNGVVIAVTPAGCRLFKPSTSKGAHKSWDDYLCDSAAVVKTEAAATASLGFSGM
ncbi:SNARE-dependent exocytosis protein, partial [Aspergillus sclerotialis]